MKKVIVYIVIVLCSVVTIGFAYIAGRMYRLNNGTGQLFATSFEVKCAQYWYVALVVAVIFLIITIMMLIINVIKNRQ